MSQLTHCEAKPLNILAFPNDILNLICEALCFHCHHQEVRIHKVSHCYGAVPLKGRPSLLALCLTSRRLCQVAQPVLFHCFCWGDIGHTTPYHVYERFKRSLDERVDLRRHVQCVDIWCVSPRCDCFLCYQDPSRMEPFQTQEIEELAEELGVEIPDKWLFDEILEEHLLQVLLMTRLPALNEIHMGINSDWRFKMFAAWSQRGNSMKKVKHMELSVGPRRSGWSVCAQGHPRSHCNHPTFDSPVEQVLVEATPNLNLLCCSAGALCNLPSFPYLESLQLTPQGSWDDKLERFLQRVPKLKRFAYTSGTEHGPAPAEIQTALIHQRDTLELLHISIGRRIVCSWGGLVEWSAPNDRPWAISSLREFTKLKYLTLESDTIWKRDKFVENRHRLPQILPDSLEVLCIDDVDALPVPVESLAEAVSAGRFPHLRRVFWREGTLHEMNLENRSAVDWLKDGGWKREVEKERREALVSRSSEKILAFPGVDGVWCGQLRGAMDPRGPQPHEVSPY